MAEHKDWRVDAAPLLFFAVVLAVKTYCPFGHTQQNGLELAGQQVAPDALDYLLTGQFSHPDSYATALAFDAPVFHSLIVQRAAKERPKGFWEHSFTRSPCSFRCWASR